jgi:hypothetical protein
VSVKEGLLLAYHMVCKRVVAESDSSTNIEACIVEQRWHNESIAVYVDCIDLVASIGSVSYVHCLREANCVAHCLAKECFSTKLDCN